MKAFLILILGLVCQSAVADSVHCEQPLGVTFALSTVTADGEVTSQRTLRIWRRHNEVAHEDVDRKITEVFNLVRDGSVKPVRYFDEHRRGIEFQPGESGPLDWTSRYQLLAARDFSLLEKEAESGEGCDATEAWINPTNARHNIVWLPEIRLPKTYSIPRGELSYRLELVSMITDADEIDRAFVSREGYYLTDFADIGDNESDPFLMKMINLGFIEHHDH